MHGTFRSRDEREVEYHGHGLHGVSRHDRAGDFVEIGGVEVNQNKVEAPACELQGDGLADARRRAGDDGPRAVPQAEVLGTAQAVREVDEEAGQECRDVQGAEGGQPEEPCRRLLEVSHSRLACLLTLDVVGASVIAVATVRLQMTVH